MSIYDKLNDLVEAIETSDEFKSYKKAAEIVDADENYSKMVKDFIHVQVNLSAAHMLGRQPSEEEIQNFNTMYTTISQVEVIKTFLEKQMYFSKIMDDISKALSKVATLNVKFLDIVPKPDDNEK